MYHVMYNQEEVISIHQKTAFYDPFVQFMMEPEATIDRALEKSNQISEAQMRQYNEENGFSHSNVTPSASREDSIASALVEGILNNAESPQQGALDIANFAETLRRNR